MRATTIKLAIFTAFTAAITFLLATVIGNFKPFQSSYSLLAAFEDATGLLKGDLVTISGVEIGKVKGATVEKGLAIVDLDIDEEVRIPKASKVAIRYRNLIGQRVVEVEPEGGAPFFEEGERVPVDQTDGPLDLDIVFNNLRPLVREIEAEDINTLSTALIESFGKHKGDLEAILSDTATLTNELAKRDEKIGRLVANLDETATALASERQELSRLLSNFADLTGILADNSGQLDRTLVNLDQALGDFATLIEGNRPGLDQDLKDLATLLSIVVAHQQDLNQIANKLDDTFRGTLKATSFGEWGNLYIFSFCALEEPGCENATTSASTASVFGGDENDDIEELLHHSLGGRQ